MTASKTQPALLGGIFIGVLSALPVVNLGNCCCCLWVVAGGALAVYLLQQNDPAPVSAADAAIVGLMAGVAGAAIGSLISIPMNLLTAPVMRSWVEQVLQNADDMPPELRRAFETWAGPAAPMGTTIALGVLGFFFSLIVNSIFATAGGALGAVMFRRTPPAAGGLPPVPPLAPPTTSPF
jgi:hypothetical protein